MAKTRKTSSSSGARVNKSAWIRSQPTSTPAKELVSKAKAAGIKLSIAQVYTARSSAKHKAGTPGKRAAGPGPGRTRASAAPEISARTIKGGARVEDLRHQFVSIAVRIGTDEAQRLLDRLVDYETSMGNAARR